MTFAGYATPPLVGLGGAVLLAQGQAWPLLWTAVVLLVLAWVKARGGLARSRWSCWWPPARATSRSTGRRCCKPRFAATIVWLLLIGGVRDAWGQTSDNGSDAAHLGPRHADPAHRLEGAASSCVALVCLVQGGERLLGI